MHASTIDTTDRPRAQPVLAALERQDCMRLDHALSHEWLESDGLGGFASSTALLCPTRRYHGLICTARPGSAERTLYLSRFEEFLQRGKREFPLSMGRYRGLFSPQGHQGLERFEMVPWPRWQYRVGELCITREIIVPRGMRAVLIRYAFSGPKDDITFNLRPLTPYRDAHELVGEHDNVQLDSSSFEYGVRLQPYHDQPPLLLSWSSNGSWRNDPLWYKDLEYGQELARGYPGHEDQFSPGQASFSLEDCDQLVIAARLDQDLADPLETWAGESRRRTLVALGSGAKPEAISAEPAQSAKELPFGPAWPKMRTALELSAEHFLYRDRHNRPGIIAGYPWFGEWGRDTYIALPGLTLARGRLELCGEILNAALPFLRGGLLPNVFGVDPEDSHYGSADAALWFVRAIWSYDFAGAPEGEILSRFRPALESIARAYLEGTDLAMQVDDGGLLSMGSEELNATWMDAQVNGVPVTPRAGAPVETNALWYALLAYLEQLAERAGEEKERSHWSALKQQAQGSYCERYWIEERGYLADVWSSEQRDESMRPNAVLAAALPFSPLTREMRTDIVRRAEVELLTPRGLRTLAPIDPRYQGRYAGNPEQRDNAYHQGTVWPWPLGFFCEAKLRAQGDSAAVRDAIAKLITGFEAHLQRAGMLQISEVFDGDPPHAAGGCIAQAWSVAELLRAMQMAEGGLQAVRSPAPDAAGPKTKRASQ